MHTDPLLSCLNPQQLEAVCHGHGPLLVLAGAGSGKTRVLTHRFAYLLRDRRVSPWNVMAVTFTNKAANEMKERTRQLVGNLPWDAWVGTFHSLCVRILRRHGHLISVGPSFSIFDDSDQLSLIRECLRDLNLDEKHYPPRAILAAISRAKDELVGPEEFARMAQNPNEVAAAQVYKRYQDKLAQNSGLDFDDLIMKTVVLLRESNEVMEHYQQQFHHILIDEYQDINTAQYVLVRILAEPQRNLCAVGDDDQSIYAFRGANVRLILNFQRDYPEAKIVKLEQNYRSTKPILDAAWSVVKRNPGRHEKRLWTDREGGDPIVVHEALNEHDEANYVVTQIIAGIRAR
ncbi:MAG: ATP-dependent helicase, partial [Armatimonadota bacterium]